MRTFETYEAFEAHLDRTTAATERDNPVHRTVAEIRAERAKTKAYLDAALPDIDAPLSSIGAAGSLSAASTPIAAPAVADPRIAEWEGKIAALEQSAGLSVQAHRGLAPLVQHYRSQIAAAMPDTEPLAPWNPQAVAALSHRVPEAPSAAIPGRMTLSPEPVRSRLVAVLTPNDRPVVAGRLVEHMPDASEPAVVQMSAGQPA